MTLTVVAKFRAYDKHSDWLPCTTLCITKKLDHQVSAATSSTFFAAGNVVNT